MLPIITSVVIITVITHRPLISFQSGIRTCKLRSVRVSRFSHVQLWDPVERSLPGSSVYRTLQTRILEWVAIPFSRGSSQPRDQTHVSYISCIGRQVFITKLRSIHPQQEAWKQQSSKENLTSTWGPAFNLSNTYISTYYNLPVHFTLAVFDSSPAQIQARSLSFAVFQDPLLRQLQLAPTHTWVMFCCFNR